MDPLSITTASIALYTTAIKIKRCLQDFANAPEVLKRLSNDCEVALHLLRAAQFRIDRRRHLEDDEDTYQGIQVLLRQTVRSVFPLCLKLRNEIARLSSVPRTRYEGYIRQALRSRDVSILERMYDEIHSMMEDIQRFEHATNADMLDRIHEVLMKIQSAQSPPPSAQRQSADRRPSSAASSQSSLAAATAKLPFEDTGPGALVWAISKKESEDVKMILEFMKVDPNFIVPGDKRESPLHLAASLGEDGIVKLLLRHGADISARDARGWSVLRAACKDGHADHPDTVRALLDAGVDPNEPWLHGRTALWYLAWRSKAPRTFALFIRLGSHVVNHECNGDRTYPTALWAAAERGRLESARELLTAGASPDVRDNTGATLLHHTGWPNADKLASLLLQHNAEPAATDNRGRQPIHCAAEAGRCGIVRLLLATERVAVNARDSTGGTALMRAAGAGAGRLVRSLVVEFGAYLWAEDAAGNDAFYYAAEGGHVLVAAYLLGASLRARPRRPNVRGNKRDEGKRDDETDDEKLETHEGDESDAEANSEANGEDTVKKSVQSHAHTGKGKPTERDINKVNRNKRTALHAAAHAGHRAMVEWLLDQGADPTLVMHESMPGLNGPATAAAVADAARHGEIAKLIRQASA
ncbi:ankyrin repeat-containing domain protein [Achaetomium macrosporum]|uniref:Ankyrin repeat-containing domain protein n=1 Tax=Achaetomium macrosporum TaxID=79813 RepID=A0AAN7C1G0_9PEZI|nr:ankyrin repeat-containing domain protein [Achaetomium macrosporum]